MAHQVVMLKDELLLRVLRLHLVHQFREIVVVGFMRLTPSGYKLDLFTTVPTDTDCTGKVLPQILLVPLRNYNRKGIRLTLTLEPFFEYA